MVEATKPVAADVTGGHIDPDTGKPLPHGVSYRGPKQYTTRNIVYCRQVLKNFSITAQTKRLLNETTVKAELA
ncbi:DNA recombinase [Acetobacter orientalis]|uniref:DNA recombinase n=1 Tax=Acetobacter orientalis TaxID=146474 RepID=A0A2Z5ZL96_9PROT|nr:DNA recombinase [Acetobacter orientalis]GAN66542.1 hypothetical protein Abor_022_119 [Acetobacter orientalis]GBR20826.1 hypothetical protein AA0481_2222 [Acetobacter orientalis NRIC 0481]GEL61922.1 hypothetical protein AOR02nite_17640 [Acetobacter orientalis]